MKSELETLAEEITQNATQRGKKMENMKETKRYGEQKRKRKYLF